MADITFETVLELAEQLTPEEQKRLIEELQVKQIRRKNASDPFLNKHPVTSLTELLTFVLESDDPFFEYRDSDFFIFRGQADSSWGLNPSIFRKYHSLTSDSESVTDNKHGMELVETIEAKRNIENLEKEIYKEFWERIRAYPQVRVNRDNPWEMLCLAQHFGVPTRLLDWTSNLIVAAYLCVAEIGKDKTEDLKDGAIWCLNATRAAANLTPGKEEILLDIYKDKQLGVARLGELPLVTSFFPPQEESKVSSKEAYGFWILRAPSVDDRIKSQSSFFTVDVTEPHIDDEKPASPIYYDQLALCRDYLFKIIIPANAKKSIKENLEKLGTDYSVIFPDLEGLGKYFQDFRESRILGWLKE